MFFQGKWEKNNKRKDTLQELQPGSFSHSKNNLGQSDFWKQDFY